MSSFKFNADDVKTIFFDVVSGVYSEELIVGPEQVQDIILEANEDKVVVSGKMYVKDNVIIDGNPVITGVSRIEQAEAAGLTPEFGCRMGVCNTCAVKKLHGAVRHVISGEVCANTDETIKPCVNVPVGDVTVAL